MRLPQIAALIGLTLITVANAGERRKLWDINLSKFLNVQEDISAIVWGIRFSPDESKIAIGFGSRWNFDPRPRRVVIVTFDKNHAKLAEFDVNNPVYPSGGSIAWSPSGSILVVNSTPPVMLRLGREAPCSFSPESEFGGFLSDDRMVVYHPGSIAPSEMATIKIVHDCSVADSWQVDAPAHVLDTAPLQDLIAMRSFQHPPEQPPELQLVSAQTHDVTRRWAPDTMDTFRGGLLLSNHGGTLCSGKYLNPEGRRRLVAACWNTQTGAKVSENVAVDLDKAAIESSGGEYLAMTDYKFIYHEGKLWQFFDLDNDYSLPRRRLIWNFRTGKEIVSWGEWSGYHQTELWGREKKSARRIKTRFPMCLSPSGRYLAEGGSGSVSAYAVQP
jgi:hypothetical protein